MRTITNDHRDTKVLNLGSNGHYGPYLATQTGVAPNDHRLKSLDVFGLLHHNHQSKVK